MSCQWCWSWKFFQYRRPAGTILANVSGHFVALGGENDASAAISLCAPARGVETVGTGAFAGRRNAILNIEWPDL
jgi:hypothetical protein